MAPRYTTRERVKDALDITNAARADIQVDDAVETASRSVEDLCHRRFYPEIDTRYFPWPNETQRSRSWRLWLDQNELISITSLASGGETITNYFLEPQPYGPPFDAVEVDLAENDVFEPGDTHQRSITITGLWGYSNDTTAAGALAEALDTSETGVDISNGAAIGVGDLIVIDSERMIVTDKTWLDSGQNLAANLLVTVNDETVAVADGTGFNARELILIDSERMRIVDIAGNNLTVERSVDGSTVAAHTSGADIYVQRTLTVERGSVGTTAATHSDTTAITRWLPPPLVASLTVAEAITQIEQENSAYARVVGSGDNQREARGAGLQDLRNRCYRSHGRMTRARAV